MTNETKYSPRLFQGVMVSSTFTDLATHRSALIKAIDGQGLKAVAMENDAAKPAGDLIDSSLSMVWDAAAYVGVISHKYGQALDDPVRNPNGYSLTELEFREAQRLGRPTLIFVMGEDHLVKKRDVECDSARREKLAAFVELAKKGRIYAKFNSLEEFQVQLGQSVAELRRHLDAAGLPAAGLPMASYTPGRFHAQPRYAATHAFCGRRSELEALRKWLSNDTEPLLLLEGIGGTGKSTLAWEWISAEATKPTHWSGCFWYSFREPTSTLADCCQHALAYMTGASMDELRKKETRTAAEQLLEELRGKPWLVVVDGLEKILVAYQGRDPDGSGDGSGLVDPILNRDPRSAIHAEDDELLRALAGAAPSRLLMTSRVVPSVLLNASGRPIPGVTQMRLDGLKLEDAEALMRNSGVRGDSITIQEYLKQNCNGHPMMTGILAGLVNDYLPDRGNFDSWVKAEGADLWKPSLDHDVHRILRTSIAKLDEGSRELLGVLCMLADSADYQALRSLVVREDRNTAVHDLERRGLIRYDADGKRWDVHPVVRGVVLGHMREEETRAYGQRVVRHLAGLPQPAYKEVEAVEEIRPRLQLMRTYLRMGRYQDAYEAYQGGLDDALWHNLGMYPETLTLMRQFFPNGWIAGPVGLGDEAAANVLNNAAVALTETEAVEEALGVSGVGLRRDMESMRWEALRAKLSNLAWTLRSANRLAQMDRCGAAALDLAEVLGLPGAIFKARLARFEQLSVNGRWDEAEEMWKKLGPNRGWDRKLYRPGYAELCQAQFQFFRGAMEIKVLDEAQRLSREGNYWYGLRHALYLRGLWHSLQGDWPQAAAHFAEAVKMDRSAGAGGLPVETLLALARFRIGELAQPQEVARRLSDAKRPDHLSLTSLWAGIGADDRAKQHALEAFRWAWADGEPYVWRWHLNQARTAADKLGLKPPTLAPYVPARHAKFPMEDEVRAAIAELRAKKGDK